MKNKKRFRSVGLIYRYHKLNHPSNRSWKIILKSICASTEIELSKWIVDSPVKDNHYKAIFASSQKYGYGQFGRNWHSPKGGVWVSAAIQKNGSNLKNSAMFGLAVALALTERIECLGVDVKIKWPNDLLVNGKKIAGILPRIFSRAGKIRLLRVGVGLNVFNNVPNEGISLKQLLGSNNMNINFWSSEVLFSIERSLDLLDDPKTLCCEIEKRLWSKKYIDKETAYQWEIKGIDSIGRLILFKEGQEKILSNYN